MKKRNLIAFLLVAVLTLSACSGSSGITEDTLSGTKWSVNVTESDSAGFDQTMQTQLDAAGAEVQLHFNSDGSMKFAMADAEGELPEGITEDMQKQMLDTINANYDQMQTKWTVDDNQLVTDLGDGQSAHYDMELNGDKLTIIQTDNPADSGFNETLVLDKR